VKNPIPADAKFDLDALRKTSAKILRLPDQAQKVVKDYLHINVNGAEAPCPYHINPGLHAANRALLGKGSPKEIEVLASGYFKKSAMYPKGNPATLRTFLLSAGIGVDCSGFAAWVLNGATTALFGRPIWKCLKFPGLRSNAVSKLRPIENISAKLLTGSVNSQDVTDISGIRPADLIRVANWHHVVVITEVGLDQAGKARYFQYAQSSCMYGPESGVRTGYALIEKPDGSLQEQRWFDNYERSVIEELISEGAGNSGVVRLKALA
jgi:hypothetical protein